MIQALIRPLLAWSLCMTSLCNTVYSLLFFCVCVSLCLSICLSVCLSLFWSLVPKPFLLLDLNFVKLKMVTLTRTTAKTIHQSLRHLKYMEHSCPKLLFHSVLAQSIFYIKGLIKKQNIFNNILLLRELFYVD